MSPYRWCALYAWIGVLLWLIVGFFAFLYGDEDWTAAQAFFFAINVGLGVGYSRPHIKQTSTLYFTSAFAMVGTSLVMTTLSLMVNHFLEGNGSSYKEIIAKSKADKERRDKYGVCGTVYTFLYDNKLGVCYWAWIGVGVWYGMAFEKFDILDALLFSLTALTTAGIIDPRNNDTSYWATSVFLLVGIPLHGLFWGGVVDGMILKFLEKYKDEVRGWVGGAVGGWAGGR